MRCLGVEIPTATRVITALGEANREAYLQRYVLHREDPDDVDEVPPGPVSMDAAPEPCWLDIPGHWPKETWNLDGTVSIEHFTLSAWLGNLLYNTDGLAKPDDVALARTWSLMPEAERQGSGKVVQLPRKPSLLRRGKPGSWQGIPTTRLHTVETYTRGKVTLRLPGEVMRAEPEGMDGFRYDLPGGWFISDHGPRQRYRSEHRFSLHLRGADPSGCAATLAHRNTLRETIAAWKEATQAKVPA